MFSFIDGDGADGAPDAEDHAAAHYVRVRLTCWSCKRQRDADLAALVATGRGDVPLVQLRWRCSWCHSATWCRGTRLPGTGPLRWVEFRAATPSGPEPPA